MEAMAPSRVAPFQLRPIARLGTSVAANNPNPKMPDYQSLPLSRVEYNSKNHPPSDHGAHGHEGHGPAPAAPKAEKKHGMIDTAKTLGGLS